MTDLKVLAEGRGEYLKVDPDGYREWVRDHKDRAMVPKLMSEKDAVEKLVADGDYLGYECNYLQRGPPPPASAPSRCGVGVFLLPPPPPPGTGRSARAA